jgi:hypothetical protein
MPGDSPASRRLGLSYCPWCRCHLTALQYHLAFRSWNGSFDLLSWNNRQDSRTTFAQNDQREVLICNDVNSVCLQLGCELRYDLFSLMVWPRDFAEFLIFFILDVSAPHLSRIVLMDAKSPLRESLRLAYTGKWHTRVSGIYGWAARRFLKP